MIKCTRFRDIPPFTRWGSYAVNVPWESVARALAAYAEHPGLDLDPDFQRVHVWSQEKQTRYVEFILRGGKTAREILFNSPGCQGYGKPGIMVLVDGKQRLEAVRSFLVGAIPAFGSLFHEYTDRMRLMIADFVFRVNDLETKGEVLQWYLDINSGGVVHTEEELAKVRRLLEAAWKEGGQA